VDTDSVLRTRWSRSRVTVQWRTRVMAFVPFLLVGTVLLVSCDGLATSYGLWSDPAAISSNLNLAQTSDGGRVYSYRPFEDGTMVFSLDAGDTWSVEEAHSGWVCATDGVLYRVNMSDEEYSAGAVLFSTSNDNGETWSDTVEVFVLDSINDGAFGVFMIQNILVVYSYDGAGGSDGSIIVSKSLDGGVTWSVPSTVDSQVHVEDPNPADIIYFEGKLYLAYFTYETDPEVVYDIVIVESDDMGDTWGNRQVVANDGGFPLIKSDGDAIYITYWAIGGGTDTPLLRFIKSTDGTTWSTPVDVGVVDDFTDPLVIHALAVSSGQLFVAYSDYNASEEEFRVRINYSADGGETWADMGDVTGSTSNTIAPTLSIDGTKLHFTWVDMGTDTWPVDVITCYRNLEIGAETIPEFGSMVVPTIVLLAVVLTVSRFKGKGRRRDGAN